MSRYEDEIADLIAYFKKQLVAHESFNMTEEEYQNGWASLPSDSLKDIARKAFDKWMSERSYELSYKQVCVSFFQAARELEKFTLVPRHPIFRLGTCVLIKCVYGEDGCEENVPGCITSVCGDEHIVTITASLWGKSGGSFCEVIHTNELDERLCLAKN